MNEQWESDYWTNGSNNRKGGGRNKGPIIVTLIVIALVLAAFVSKNQKSNVRNNTYTLEENSSIKTTNEGQGNPFVEYHAPMEITVGYYNVSAQTDPAKGKFYIGIESLDINKKPSKHDFILDLAISNDGGVNKTFLCTDRYVEKDELSTEGKVILTFSLEKVIMKSGTTIYYRIKENVTDTLPTVGEFTL